MVHEFSRFLLAIPEPQRTGHVFNASNIQGRVSRRRDTVGKWIAAVGEQAGVKVDKKGGEALYASPHDFRGPFGHRWSHRVSPVILKELMRHACVQTTKQYYVDINAAETANMLKRLESGPEVTPASIDFTAASKRQ